MLKDKEKEKEKAPVYSYHKEYGDTL
jgi:hypothetical protein